MFLNFFTELRAAKVPVTLKEYLMLMEGMDKSVIGRRVEEFYYLSRSALVKDPEVDFGVGTFQCPRNIARQQQQVIGGDDRTAGTLNLRRMRVPVRSKNIHRFRLRPR